MILDSMPGLLETFHSQDTADVNQLDPLQEEIPIEYLHSLNPAGLPPACLNLKKGVPVVLLRNLHPQQGLCNGTRLTLTRIGRHCLEGRILGGRYNGQLRLLPRIKLTTQETQFPFILSRKQFPIRLCFAMTVNKAQGQTLETIGLDLRTSAFAHEQLYVALSRAKKASTVYILWRSAEYQQTENIIYPEVLLDEA